MRVRPGVLFVAAMMILTTAWCIASQEAAYWMSSSLCESDVVIARAICGMAQADIGCAVIIFVAPAVLLWAARS